MIEIAIVEDEEIWRLHISKMLNNLFCEEIKIYPFSSKELFEEFNRSFDIVFFDVELGDSSREGLEMCRLYKGKYQNQECMAIILTTHTEFVRHGYLVNAFRYIDKGNLEEELTEAVRSIELKRQGRTSISVHLSKIGITDIRLDSVVCIETEGRKIAMRLNDGKSIFVDETFSTLAKLFEPNGFYMIRKGVLVNLKHIVDFKEDYVVLRYIIPEKRYYISRRRYNEFLKVFTDWRIQRASG